MWRDRILEAKKAKGATTKSMAAYANMTERSVSRILSGESMDPYVSNVIVLGASVGLSPLEIFAETGLVVGNQDLTALQAEVDRLSEELEALLVEVTQLRGEVASLSAERDLLRLKLEHKDELVKHKDAIIDLLRQSRIQ